ncbi:MAG: hypothetical protein PHW02_02260 [bacterium]|nr:hypothetical protein [bacterium]
MKRLVSFLIFVASIFLLLFSTYKSSLISNDKAVYKYCGEELIVDYVNPTSNAYRAGLHIADKIVSVNGIEIYSRHVLHNMVFDRTNPFDTLVYVVEREDELITLTMASERRFSLSELIQFLIFGIAYSLLTMIFYNVFPKSKTHRYLYLFFVSLSLLMTLFNVPFSHRILYPTMMVVSTVMTVSLLYFTQHYLFEFSVKWPRLLFLLFTLISFAFWISTYWRWTYSMTEGDYSSLITSLRFFQLSLASAAIYSIVSIFIKVLRLYVTKQPKEYFIVTFLMLLILILYPLLYALPFALRQKELIPFSVYFYMFLILLFLTVLYRKRLSRVFL